jgi:hypothetical protein
MKGLGRPLLYAAVGVSVCACGGPTAQLELSDGGVDAGRDAGLDAGLDDAGDAGFDAGSVAVITSGGCTLQVSPATVDFGEVTPGTQASPLSVTLANIGSDPCVVEGVSLAGDDYSAFILLAGLVEKRSLSPPSGGPDPTFLIVPVTFDPTQLRSYSGLLAFSVGEPDGGLLHEGVPLSGIGSVAVKSCFSLPLSLDFGTVGVSDGQFCSFGKKEVVAINGCPFAVTIDSMAIEPSDSPFVFSPPAFPIVVAADSTSFPFLIGFRDSGPPGDVSATLLVQTDLQSAPFTFALHGTVSPPATQTDTFTGDLLSLGNQFPLTGNPIPSSISVSLNDFPLPAASWSYDQSRNVIVISDAITFRLSDVLRVSYWLSCP